MLHILMLFVPMIGILGIIYKLPNSWKDVFFKIPTFITSTACSFLMKMFVHGVMGPYAVILGDIVLYPLFCFWKKARAKKKDLQANFFSPSQVIQKLKSASDKAFLNRELQPSY